jgi:hypothetical protein
VDPISALAHCCHCTSGTRFRALSRLEARTAEAKAGSGRARGDTLSRLYAGQGGEIEMSSHPQQSPLAEVDPNKPSQLSLLDQAEQLVKRVNLPAPQASDSLWHSRES